MSTRTNKHDAPMCGRDAKAKQVKNQHQIHLLRTYVMFLMGQSSQDDDVPDYLIFDNYRTSSKINQHRNPRLSSLKNDREGVRRPWFNDFWLKMIATHLDDI